MALGDYLAGLGLAATIRKFHRAHHATFNHRRRCGSMDLSGLPCSTKTGFTNNHTPLTRKWTSFFAYRGAIASASSVGNKLRTISRVSKSVAEALARTYIREGLAPRRLSRSRCKTSRSIKASRDDSFAVTYLNLELA